MTMQAGRDAVLITSDRGRVFTTRVSATGVFFYFEGHVDLDMFSTTMVHADAALSTGRAMLFGDGQNWQTYAVGYRDAWTRWFLTNRKRVAHTPLFVRSPLLKMGVQVVNLFTGDSITTVGSAARLYDTLRSHVPDVAAASRAWPADIAAFVRG